MDARQQKAEVMQALLGIVLDEDALDEDRASARCTLRRLADGGVVETLGGIVDEIENPTLLAYLCEVLSGVSCDSDTVPPMICLLWHDAPDVRQAAMLSLARSKSKAAAAALAVVLADCRDAETIFGSTDERLARRARDSILGRALS